MRKWQQAKRKQEWLARQEERQQKQEEREVEFKGDPLGAKQELCNTLIAYLSRLQGGEQKVSANEDEHELPKPSERPSGAYLPKKASDNEQFSLLKAKKPAGAGKSRTKSGPKPTGTIKHSVALFEQFQELGVSAPLVYANIPDVIASLQAKQEELKKEWHVQQEAIKRRAEERKAAETKRAEEPSQQPDQQQESSEQVAVSDT